MREKNESERDVVAFRRAVAFHGFRRWRARSRRSRTRRTRSRCAAAFAATTATGAAGAAEKLYCFRHHTQPALLLAGLLVVPLVQPEPAFDQNRAPLAHVLAHVFSRAAKDVHVHKS